jgi:CBS domain-containing membrane protein
MTRLPPARQILRMVGPAMGPSHAPEVLRAAIGAGLGLVLCDLLLWVMVGDAGVFERVVLIAPFGASAFLIFTVPNSPLAQPYSVVIGNTLSALIALGVVHLVPAALPAAGLSVALAIAAMAVARAFHPPAGAVALTITLIAPEQGAMFALNPVLTGSVVLVLLGTVWNRATGRVYPFRQPLQQGPHGTPDARPDRRLGLGPDDLAGILDRLRMAQNIGVEDLARAISAAETEATARQVGGLSAGDVMSRHLVTLFPDTPFDHLADLFTRHRFHTLPVIRTDGSYLGLVQQLALLRPEARELTAVELIEPGIERVTPATGFAPLIDLLADGRQQAVPVVDAGRLVGLITRSDMIALLARRLRRG